MKRSILFLIRSAFFAILGAAALPAIAQTIGTGPYYATPSWDQTFPCDTSANCPRFIVLSNFFEGAVLDRETGLVWQRVPSPITSDWAFAQVTCITGGFGFRNGWRLPSVAELRSLY